MKLKHALLATISLGAFAIAGCSYEDEQPEDEVVVVEETETVEEDTDAE